MRRKAVAGNWKMNKDLSESVGLISDLKNLLNSHSVDAEVIICPPFISLETASTLIKNSQIKLGAQNMHFESEGAFTGEISFSMLRSVGCEYVILGHSERRALFFENDEIINKKIKKAVGNYLKPIFCVGETLEERAADMTTKVVENQIEKGLAGITHQQMAHVIIAYEPIWAIGTGQTATPEQAQAVHSFIRSKIKKLYDTDTAENLILQYGGSVKPENSKELMSQPDIDGALVGGACLKAQSFFEIINSVHS